MYFQPLDNKKECYAYFYEGAIHEDLPSSVVARTWDYSVNVDIDADYAYLYCGGRSLQEVCPEELKRELDSSTEKLKSFFRSFHIAKVSMQENCFFDLVPDRFLLRYFNLKNEITEYVFDNFEKPENYDFLKDLNVMTTRMSRPLSLDHSEMVKKSHDPACRKLLRAVKEGRTSIVYNIFGTKTGRLSTAPNSFPLLTLKKELRSVIKPRNHWFVELDFNAAELRTLLSLCGKSQPMSDIHEWNRKNIYQGNITRDEAKKRVFSWLYNPDSTDYLTSRFYDRAKVLEEYWDGTHIETPFGRKIEADRHHALNYIVQSTSSDLFLKSAIKIDKILKDRKSKIAFTLHDSMVIDYHEEDSELLRHIVEEFSNTPMGKWKANVSAGKSFGEMVKI